MLRLGEKGAAAVEFGLLLPLLMVITFGIIEFGFIMYDQAIVTNAAREGARAGIVYSDPAITEGAIRDVVSDYCADHLVSLGSASSVSSEVDGDCTNPDTDLAVTVTYPYDFLVLPSFVTSLTGTLNLTSTTTMRCENRT